MTTAVPGQTTSRPRLAQVFDPLSVAVVGATDDPGKWGYQLATGALKGEQRRPVYLVNARRSTVLGRRSYATLSELPSVPELVAIAVPLSVVDTVVDEALTLGVKAFVAVNAGLGESGEEGLERQRRLVERIRDTGAVLVGPNCLGVVDTHSVLELAWTQAGARGLPTGPLNVISQSGNLGLELALGSRARGIGLARYTSVGNQADLEIADFLEAAIDHEPTRVIAIYAEEFRRPRTLFAVIRQAAAAGKTVVLVAPRGQAATSAAQSHTGALTSNAAVIEAVCRDAGAVWAPTVADALNCIQIAAGGRQLTGRRIGIVSDGGGHAVLACDEMTDAELTVPRFSPELQAQLRENLSESSAVANPVDMAAASPYVLSFERAATAMINSCEVDAVVITGGFGSFAEVSPELGAAEVESAARIAKASNSRGVPLLVHSMFDPSEALLELRQWGASVFPDLGAGARAASLLISARESAMVDIAELPAANGTGPLPTGYFGGRHALTARGVQFPEAHEVRNAEDAITAAEAVGYPVALKAVDLLHKSDAGGVALGIESADELAAEFAAMRDRTSSSHYSVERMASAGSGIEMIVGATRDPVFGPVVLVGFGGIFAEVVRDIQLCLWPAPVSHLRDLILRLKGAPILTGARERPPLDLDALAATAAQVGDLLMSDDRITDVELNPVRVTAQGVTALDVRVLTSDDSRHF